MTKTEKFFNIAKKAALAVDDRRKYKLGAVGIRTDGAIVESRNLPCHKPDANAHAEFRLAKKLNWGSVVYVVRVLADGSLTMAKPCVKCVSALRLRGVKRCYYSISDCEHGVMKL